jgi:hypothetical protein
MSAHGVTSRPKRVCRSGQTSLQGFSGGHGSEDDEPRQRISLVGVIFPGEGAVRGELQRLPLLSPYSQKQSMPCMESVVYRHAACQLPRLDHSSYLPHGRLQGTGAETSPVRRSMSRRVMPHFLARVPFSDLAAHNQGQATEDTSH